MEGFVIRLSKNPRNAETRETRNKGNKPDDPTLEMSSPVLTQTKMSQDCQGHKVSKLAMGSGPLSLLSAFSVFLLHKILRLCSLSFVCKIHSSTMRQESHFLASFWC